MHTPRSLATLYDYQGGGDMCPDIAFFRYEDFSAKVLVLEGPTGCGKTTWAMLHAPKPALIVTHLDMLKKEFDPNFHKSVIFDDMSFSHQPREQQLHILEQRYCANIHIRYSYVSLPAGFPKIFTCNIYPFINDPAIERRIHHKLIVEGDKSIRVAAPKQNPEIIEL